jgi:hypothetical protein
MVADKSNSATFSETFMARDIEIREQICTDWT